LNSVKLGNKDINDFLLIGIILGTIV